MRVRTNYFKVTDMQAEPTKSSTHGSEFMVGSTGIGFLQNRAGHARALRSSCATAGSTAEAKTGGVLSRLSIFEPT